MEAVLGFFGYVLTGILSTFLTLAVFLVFLVLFFIWFLKWLFLSTQTHQEAFSPDATKVRNHFRRNRWGN